MSESEGVPEGPCEFVTLIIPVLNEKEHIISVIDQVRPLDHDYEILVADGGSTDGTIEIVAALDDVRVRLVSNPKRVQASGVNAAVAESDARSRFFIRADAHCAYPVGWSDKIVNHLIETGATSVVVAMHTQEEGPDERMQSAIAFAQNSKLGNGGAAHREGQRVSRYVDHGHHAGFLKSFFVENGGYDPEFSVNEDGEYDQRTSKAGAKVWLAADAQITYFPRKSLQNLAVQYFRYGKGRCSTVLKHRVKPRLRQLVPVAVAGSALGGMLLQFWSPVFVLPFACYLSAAFFYTYRVTPVKKGGRFALNVFFAAVMMHLSWGTGFLWRLAQKALFKTSEITPS